LTSSVTGSGRPVVVEVPDRFAGRTLRCGVIGVGRMGQHHARVYSTLKGCSLVGVVDSSSDRCGAIADKFDTTAMSTVQQLLEAGVDCVSIAVPTTHHFAAAEPLLKAGVACLIEKPLAGDVETARKLKDLSETTGSVLMVGHIERFNPVMRAMQKAMQSGDPIIPRFLEIHRVSPMTFRSVDVGVVMDMMIHDLDVVLMLMGGQEPDEVSASGVAVITGHEDICNARLTWRKAAIAGGKSVVANITASRLALKTERIARITGENCYVKIDYGAKSGTLIRRIANELQMREVRDQIRAGADLTHLKWHELVNIEPLTVDDAEPIVAEISAFIEAVRTGARPPIDAEAGFANVRTAERIVQSIRETL
jgi:predicted dehydrogenase